MTAIAALMHRGHAILYGDSRVTVASEEAHSSLPAVDDPERFVPREYFQQIAGLVRKIYIISPSLAVGVAGNYIYALALLEDLKRSVVPANIEEVREFFDSYREHVSKDLTVVGAISDGGEATTFQFDFKSGAFESGGEYMQGDGGWLFKDMIAKGASFIDRLDKSESVIANVLSALGFFYAEEDVSGSFLENASGGAYEAIWWDGCQFQWIPDFTLLPFVIDAQDKNNVTCAVPRIINYRPFNEYGAVRSYKASLNGHLVMIKDRNSVIPVKTRSIWDRPFQRGKLELEKYDDNWMKLLSKPLSASAYVVHYAVKCGKGHIKTVTAMWEAASATCPIKVLGADIHHCIIDIADLPTKEMAGFCGGPRYLPFGDRPSAREIGVLR